MKSFLCLTIFSSLAARAIATHGGRVIPEVDEVVDKMTKEFEPAVTYAGPTEKLDKPYSTSHPTSSPTPASYWLADIKHQGIASFNSDATYQVFRNVKDFGAKGKMYYLGEIIV